MLPKFLVITARGSLLKADSMHFRDHYRDGQSCLGCQQAAFAGVKANLVSKPCRLLAKRIRFLLPPTTALASLKSIQPQTPSSISMEWAREACQSPPLPRPRVPAAILPSKWSRLPRLGCFWTAAQLPDRVTALASHLEWGLMWDMQKIIIKAGPTAQLA